MAHTHKRRGSWLDWRACYTGKPASSAHTGQPGQQMWSWLSQWRGLDFISSYSGRADATINGAGDCDFYIVCCAPDKTDTGDTSRAVGIGLSLWAYDSDAAAPAAHWYAPHGTASPQALWTPTGPVYDYTSTAGEGAAAHFFFAYDESNEPLTYVPDNSGVDGCLLCRVTLDNAMPAALTVFHLPQATLTGDNLIVPGGNVATGEIIRGADGASVGDSLGALIHVVGTGDGGDESAERMGRRTLFQTSYPVGVYHTNSAGYVAHRQDTNGAAFEYRVRARNLLGASSGVSAAKPALVLTADEGVRVRFSSATAGDTWTYTVPGGGVSNQLVTASGGDAADLDIDNDAIETVTIDVDTSAAGGAVECLLQTVALFEAGEW